MENGFISPDFLKNQSAEEIHTRMLKTLPSNIDKSEASFVWDFTYPTALAKAEMVEFVLMEAIKNIFPQWASGKYLDYHAENRGLIRKKQEYATCTVTVKGNKNTIIPKGYKILTMSTLDASGIEFEVNEEIVIPDSGVIDVKVTSTVAGKIGNVAADTIVLMSKPIKGIISLSNNDPSYGGFETEGDDSLKRRIKEYDQQQGLLFVGSVSDYNRWAMSVSGVGSAKILDASDDTGTVTIIIADENGEPASENLCENVFNYIMRPDNPMEKLAPINALLNVIPSKVMSVGITATLELEMGYTIESVRTSFIDSLNKYFNTPEARQELTYYKIGSILINTSGIHDYTNLLVNGGVENIFIALEEVPAVDKSRVVFLV